MNVRIFVASGLSPEVTQFAYQLQIDQEGYFLGCPDSYLSIKKERICSFNSLRDCLYEFYMRGGSLCKRYLKGHNLVLIVGVALDLPKSEDTDFCSFPLWVRDRFTPLGVPYSLIDVQKINSECQWVDVIVNSQGLVKKQHFERISYRDCVNQFANQLKEYFP